MRGLLWCGGGATTVTICCLSAPLFSEAAFGGQSTDCQYLENTVLSAHPGSYMLCTGCARNWICALLPAPWPGAGMSSCYCPESWDWPELTAVYCMSFSLGHCKLPVDARDPAQLHQTASATVVAWGGGGGGRRQIRGASSSTIFPEPSPLEIIVYIFDLSSCCKLGAFTFLKGNATAIGCLTPLTPVLPLCLCCFIFWVLHTLLPVSHYLTQSFYLDLFIYWPLTILSFFIP